jgi:hypothetical protein
VPFFILRFRFFFFYSFLRTVNNMRTAHKNNSSLYCTLCVFCIFLFYYLRLFFFYILQLTISLSCYLMPNCFLFAYILYYIDLIHFFFALSLSLFYGSSSVHMLGSYILYLILTLYISFFSIGFILCHAIQFIDFFFNTTHHWLSDVLRLLVFVCVFSFLKEQKKEYEKNNKHLFVCLFVVRVEITVILRCGPKIYS